MGPVNTVAQEEVAALALVVEEISEYVDTLQIYKAEITLTSEEILNIFSSPKLAIASPGAGKAISIISGSMSLTFNSVAYSGNVIISLITDTANMYQGTFYTLNSTVSRWSRFNNVPGINATDTQLIADKALYIKNLVGNPSAGNSGGKIYITYEIIDL
ncbi:MAG: hypothetical protein V4549_07380 [Bacteroidota bacterium]